jgi:hypothetical protein
MAHDRHVLISEFSLAAEDWSQVMAAAETIVGLRRKLRISEVPHDIRAPSARRNYDIKEIDEIANAIAMKWLKV